MKTFAQYCADQPDHGEDPDKAIKYLIRAIEKAHDDLATTLESALEKIEALEQKLEAMENRDLPQNIGITHDTQRDNYECKRCGDIIVPASHRSCVDCQYRSYCCGCAKAMEP